MNLSFKIAFGVFLGLTLFFFAKYILQIIFEIVEAKGFMGLTIGYIMCLFLNYILIVVILFPFINFFDDMNNPYPFDSSEPFDIIVLSFFLSMPITALIIETLFFKYFTNLFNNILCTFNIFNLKGC